MNFKEFIEQGGIQQLKRLQDMQNWKRGFDNYPIDLAINGIKRNLNTINWDYANDFVIDATIKQAADIMNYANMIIVKCNRIKKLSNDN
jgi:hypothetical protein